jgi:hypothetical protein
MSERACGEALVPEGLPAGVYVVVAFLTEAGGMRWADWRSGSGMAVVSRVWEIVVMRAL